MHHNTRNTSWYSAILDNNKINQYEIYNLNFRYFSRFVNNNYFRYYNTIYFIILTYYVQPNYGFSNISIQFNCHILPFQTYEGKWHATTLLIMSQLVSSLLVLEKFIRIKFSVSRFIEYSNIWKCRA